MTRRLRRASRRLRRLPAQATLVGLRAGLTMLERVSPERGGAWAERLFFRVPPTPPASRRHRAAPEGRPVELDLDGRTIRGMVWGPDAAPLVVLVHGWGGWWQQMLAYVQPLLVRGHRVLAFDALGHGSSDGTRHSFGSGRIPEFADCLAALAARYGQPSGIVAHSGGAMAVMLAVHEGRITPARLAFVGPSVRIEDVIAFVSRMFGIGPRSAAVMVRRVEERIHRSASDFDTPAMARDLADSGRLPRLLIVHDADDPDAPIEGAEVLHAAWPGSRLHRTAGLGHRRPLWTPSLVREVVDFLVAAEEI